MVPSYDVNISHDNHAIESKNWWPIYKICLHQMTWIHHTSIQGHFTSLINYNSSLHFTDKAMNLTGSCLLSSNHIIGLKFEPNLVLAPKTRRRLLIWQKTARERDRLEN